MKTLILYIVALLSISIFAQAQDSLRISKDIQSASVKCESEVESGPIYLYAAHPFPIPAGNYVKSQIYWDPRYDINKAQITAYDLYGIKVNTEEITVDKTESYSGLMKWDCTNIPNGVYLIRISLAGSNINVMVIIAK